ncbi:MAG: ATP-binding protein [Candidatus Paceibacterota bacterium]|jgi:signal transduction histidine kinase
MEIFAVSGLVNGIISSAFGVLVISKNWREKVNRIYFFMVISLALWSFSYWQWLLSTDYNSALSWVRLLSIGSLFIPVFFFHWVILLINKKNIVNNVILTIAYFAAITILFFYNSPLFIEGLQQKLYFEFWPNAGNLYDIYFSYIYIGLITYSLYLLIRSYLMTIDKDKKGQLLYIIFGAILGFGGGLTNFPLWFGIEIPPYGNFLVSAFPFLLGYSILRFRLFNAKTIATEILVFFMVIILFIQAVISQSLIEGLLRGAFFIVVSIFGYLLIRSVYHEVAQRERIEKLAGALEVANRGQQEFLHFLSHEVKGYFTVVSAMLDAVLTDDDYGPVSERLRGLLQTGLKRNKSAVANVEDILISADLRNGAITYDMKPLDMKVALIDLIEEIRPEAEEKGLKLQVSIDENKDYNVVVDRRHMIDHAIRNIIENAIIYTPKGEIMVTLSRHYGNVLLAVADSGVGLTDEDKNRLFTEGGKGKESSKINAHSTGHGLYIVKRTVEAHKGRVWAESEGKGKGSIFFMELPGKSK